MNARVRPIYALDEIYDSLLRVQAAYAGERQGKLEGSGKSLNMDLAARLLCDKLGTLRQLEKRLEKSK